jgi:hypothetical protein
MSVITLQDLFGLASLLDFEGRAMWHISGHTDARQLLNAFAVFGDAELSHLVVAELWATRSAQRLSPGAVSKKRSLYVCNQSLAGFLQLATTLGVGGGGAEADALARVFRIGSDATEHSWGTVFEALLWLAVLEQRVDAASIVRRLMRWVDANVDPALLQRCVDDDDETSLQLDSFTMRALFERALPPPTPPPPRVRAALSWAPLPVAPAASRALFSDHDFDVDDMEPHHCTIKGSYAAPTWHGCFCRSCSAMLVVRQVSNRRSDFFIVGFKRCPQTRLSAWLDDYVDDLPIHSGDVTDAIPIEDVRTWILADDADGRRDVDCRACGARYRFTKCSNRQPCRQHGCSNKYVCHKESHSCSAACAAIRKSPH